MRTPLAPRPASATVLLDGTVRVSSQPRLVRQDTEIEARLHKVEPDPLDDDGQFCDLVGAVRRVRSR